MPGIRHINDMLDAVLLQDAENIALPMPLYGVSLLIHSPVPAPKDASSITNLRLPPSKAKSKPKHLPRLGRRCDAAAQFADDAHRLVDQGRVARRRLAA